MDLRGAVDGAHETPPDVVAFDRRSYAPVRRAESGKSRQSEAARPIRSHPRAVAAHVSGPAGQSSRIPKLQVSPGSRTTMTADSMRFKSALGDVVAVGRTPTATPFSHSQTRASPTPSIP